jgi:integrase
LRTIYNKAISEEIVNKKLYPFGKKAYQIPQAENLKTILEEDEIRSFFNFDTITQSEEWAKDMWMFIFLSNGINVNDILRLKLKNIIGDEIHFVREKTKNTTKASRKTIRITLEPYAIEVINKWAIKSRNPEDYLFPYLKHGMSAEQEKRKIHQTVQNINRHTKKIGKEIGFVKDLTTYIARHTCFTMLIRNGATVNEISDLAGHQDISTTMRYIATLPLGRQRELTNTLSKMFA